MMNFTSNAGQRAAKILLSTGTAEGHWVTIGAEGPPGDRHGGSPMFIKDGVIEKGPKSLAGKKISQLRGGKSTLGGKGTPMERVREHLKKLNESGKKHSTVKEQLDATSTARAATRDAHEHKTPEHYDRAAEAHAKAAALYANDPHFEAPSLDRQASGRGYEGYRDHTNAMHDARESAKRLRNPAEHERRNTPVQPPEPAKAAEPVAPAKVEPAKPKVDISRTPEFHNRVRELRAQGHDMTMAVGKTHREFEARDPSLRREPVAPKPVRPAKGGSSSMATPRTESTPSPATAKPVTAPQAPATDFHERVKQLKAGGKSHVGAVIQAADEKRARANAIKTTDLNPVEHIEAAKAAHAKGDTESFKTHVGEAVKKTKAGRKPGADTREDIKARLVTAWKEQTGGGATAEHDKALAAFHSPYTFLRTDKTKSGYPGEVERFLEGHKELGAKMFRLTDSPQAASGADAMGALGEDRYFKHIEEVVGGEARQALEHARNSPDPQLKFLAAVHDTILPKSEGRSVRKEATDSASLKVGEEFTINKVPVEVKEDAEGDKFIQDHGDIPTTPLESLPKKISVDKGSRREKEITSTGGDDFFADVRDDEPAPMQSKAGKEAMKPFRTSGQLDLRGNEVGELTGSQKPLFAPAHEPVKFEAPQAERIGSKNAADPRHTAEMFPAQSKAGKEAVESAVASGGAGKEPPATPPVASPAPEGGNPAGQPPAGWKPGKFIDGELPGGWRDFSAKGHNGATLGEVFFKKDKVYVVTAAKNGQHTQYTDDTREGEKVTWIQARPATPEETAPALKERAEAKVKSDAAEKLKFPGGGGLGKPLNGRMSGNELQKIKDDLGFKPNRQYRVPQNGSLASKPFYDIDDERKIAIATTPHYDDDPGLRLYQGEDFDKLHAAIETAKPPPAPAAPSPKPIPQAEKESSPVVSAPKTVAPAPADEGSDLIPIREAKTKYGNRHVHSFAPSKQFWDARNKGRLPDAVSVGKNPRTGAWEASIWGNSPTAVSKHAKKLAAMGIHGVHFSRTMFQSRAAQALFL